MNSYNASRNLALDNALLDAQWPEALKTAMLRKRENFLEGRASSPCAFAPYQKTASGVSSTPSATRDSSA